MTGILEKLMSVEKIFDKEDSRRYEVAKEMIEKERKTNRVLDDAIKAVAGKHEGIYGYEDNAMIYADNLSFLQKYTPFGKADRAHNEAVAHLENDVGTYSSLKTLGGAEKARFMLPYLLFPAFFGFLGSSKGLAGALGWAAMGFGLTLMLRGPPGSYNKQIHYKFLANSKALDDRIKEYTTHKTE